MRRVAEWGDVVSGVADMNFRFDLNSDVEELLRYNKIAKQETCGHEQQRVSIDSNDFPCNNVCEVCDKILPLDMSFGGRR